MTCEYFLKLLLVFIVSMAIGFCINSIKFEEAEK